MDYDANTMEESTELMQGLTTMEELLDTYQTYENREIVKIVFLKKTKFFPIRLVKKLTKSGRLVRFLTSNRHRRFVEQPPNTP